MNRDREVVRDVVLMLAALAFFAVGLTLGPKLHSHDGGRTWHAHAGGGE